MRACLLVLGAAACGGGSSAKPDALVAPTLTLYLSFDGVTITPATGASNAATNTSTIVTAQTTVPPYLQGVATRDTTIASIVSETTARFSPFDVAVVTDRPASLDYFMIVYTGLPSVVFPGQGAGLSAVTTIPCQTAGAPPDANGIGFQFQSAASSDTYTPVERANLAIPVVALAQNIPPTSKNGDCLCFAAAGCGLPPAACTIGGAGTPVDTTSACTGAPATIDEMSSLAATLGTAH